MSETPPEQPTVEAPTGMAPDDFEFWDDDSRTYYERQPDGTLAARPFNEEEVQQIEDEGALDALHEEALAAIDYLDGRIDLSLAYFAMEAPTAEQTAAQIKNLSDLAAYSGGTLKRVIKVLSVLTNRPI
ncbi:hypothetical protein G6W61_10135 [Streptomyces sp. KAI-26]|uniref:hypothetical protein n=1 Tax=Streptomyces sp. KAI-26 TaxID=1169747 RepID=UPI0015874904|nr:hypothetical protein [Streptomyces sp. KAI-26]NUV86565.1 hypothetical protein [Streptomyces sp. KAI-26]NUW21240.1 hypothetical protein [Streptomyces roseoviolaceus]